MCKGDKKVSLGQIHEVLITDQGHLIDKSFVFFNNRGVTVSLLVSCQTQVPQSVLLSSHCVPQSEILGHHLVVKKTNGDCPIRFRVLENCTVLILRVQLKASYANNLRPPILVA